ncbi:OsmC-like protein [Actinomyces bovis]|uniref:OsmC-like protein n=1 Tax=Actinomyces bovis TaxID=1658 RepID=A0ABY1VLT9_9ACTO|nr:OsmC family protein [Actinomyces bovis]SPT53055.1 OsmC-like protein [Actinomyces bovis]VEG53013.1 OsmC-like protein [Actinomyces israelii]
MSHEETQPAAGTTRSTSSRHVASAALPANAVWAERTGTRQYQGHNDRGATVRIGMGPGEFSPGELLKLALATCNSLSADHRLARTLGADFDANVVCTSVKHETEERYESLAVELITDLSALDTAALRQLIANAEGAIDRNCTVGHTLEQGAPFTFALLDDPDA